MKCNNSVIIFIFFLIATISRCNVSLAGTATTGIYRAEVGKKQITVNFPQEGVDKDFSGGWDIRNISFSNGVSTIIIWAEPTEAKEIDEISMDKINSMLPQVQKGQYDKETYQIKEDIYINGIKAKEISYGWQEVFHEVRQLFFVRDGLLISCYFSTFPARRAENEPVFDAVVQSIRVEDAPPKVGYAPIEWRRHYVSPDGLFEIDAPYGWETEEYQNDPDYTGVTFTRQEHIKRANEEWREGATIEVYVWKDAPAEWEVMERSKRHWEEENRGFARDSEANLRVKEVEIAGVKGYEVRIWRPLYWDLHPERKVWVMIHFYKGGLKYRISYVAMGRNFDKDEKVFKECLRSFRVLR